MYAIRSYYGNSVFKKCIMTSNKHSRRSFFKGLAATSLGVALAPSLLKATVKGADDPERIKSIAGPVEPIWRNRQSGMQS